MAGEIRGLTLWRPWGSLLFVAEDPAHPEAPPKLVENRPWFPRRVCQPMRAGIALALPGQPLWLAIHNGLHRYVQAWADAQALWRRPEYRSRRALDGSVPRPGEAGLIVGVCRLARVLDVEALGPDHPEVRCHGSWIHGPFAWEVADRVLLPTPVACRGAQGLWKLPPDVLEQVRQQWSLAAGQAGREP